jgi:hypothetical protein
MQRRLPFTLDPQIIHHVIYNQAGSIGKAIIELIMNSIDAGARVVRISMTLDGFVCADDGKGFVSREDVLNYFGRFGTPHQEGDATYGRFRLGRGQIMAHASTVWESNAWKMSVDTKTMGYHYDLDELVDGLPGCVITGTWYERLSQTELLSTVQEIRDLVRYTPIGVELNGRAISRDPKAEKWDDEDEFAYYRAKPEGSVAIYNLGVLVRHDASQLWGAGGIIVSKRAIDLNVSRTEILRKTCAVWKPIAKHFAKMAEEVAAKLGDHRKTESRREKSARALLSGDPNCAEIYRREEVITLLPGKQHVTLDDFLHKAQWGTKSQGKYTVVLDGFDVPKGESIARAKIIRVVHPQTLERFGAYGVEDFRDALRRAMENVVAATPEWSRRTPGSLPEAVDFGTIRDAFVERTFVVSEKQALDKQTRRVWTAMRWCLENYAGLCAGGEMRRGGRLHWRDPKRMEILLGESNTAQAWTDGKTYIAFEKTLVERLNVEPLKAANYLFSLAEHEVAHEGDSVDCGHDEAFYQRYHDISLRMSETRARYMHIFLAKLHTSMESEGKPRDNSKAYYESRLASRVGDGRQKRGLSPAIEDVTADPLVTANVPGENMAFIDVVNSSLVAAGVCPPPPDWDQLVLRAKEKQVLLDAENAERLRALREEREGLAAQDMTYEADETQERERIAAELGVDVGSIAGQAAQCLWGLTGEALKLGWAEKWWESSAHDDERYAAMADEDWHEQDQEYARAAAVADASAAGVRADVGADLAALIEEGETDWSLERNAAAAGFFRVADYLRWRRDGA